jgi:Leucine-rich repeat (LRR) protein
MTSNDLRGLLINHNKLTSLPDMDNPAHLERLHTLNFKYNRFIELPNVLRNLDKAFLASFYGSEK